MGLFLDPQLSEPIHRKWPTAWARLVAFRIPLHQNATQSQKRQICHHRSETVYFFWDSSTIRRQNIYLSEAILHFTCVESISWACAEQSINLPFHNFIIPVYNTVQLTHEFIQMTQIQYLMSSSEAKRMTARAFSLLFRRWMVLSKSGGLRLWGIFRVRAMQIPPKETKQKINKWKTGLIYCQIAAGGLKRVIYWLYCQWL